MKRPKFKLRTLMIAIAITALPAWAYRLKCRSREFAKESEKHLLEAKYISDYMLTYRGFTMWGEAVDQRPLTDADKINYANLEHRLLFEMRMYHKYHHAKSFPWLPVGPDPVPPPHPFKDNIWVEEPDQR